MKNMRTRKIALIAGVGALVSPVAAAVPAFASGPVHAAGMKDGSFSGSVVPVIEVVKGVPTNYGNLQLIVGVSGGQITSITWPISPNANAYRAKAKVAAKALTKAKAAVKKAKKTKTKADDKMAAKVLKKANAAVKKADADVAYHSNSEIISNIFLPSYRDEAITAQSAAIASITGASATGVSFKASLQAAITKATK